MRRGIVLLENHSTQVASAKGVAKDFFVRHRVHVINNELWGKAVSLADGPEDHGAWSLTSLVDLRPGANPVPTARGLGLAPEERLIRENHVVPVAVSIVLGEGHTLHLVGLGEVGNLLRLVEAQLSAMARLQKRGLRHCHLELVFNGQKSFLVVAIMLLLGVQRHLSEPLELRVSDQGLPPCSTTMGAVDQGELLHDATADGLSAQVELLGDESVVFQLVP